MKSTLKKFLSIVLVISMLMSMCTFAFATDDKETQAQNQINEAGGTYQYYDANGETTTSDKDWVVRTMRKLEATGTENLFDVTTEIAVKEGKATVSSKAAAVTLIVDVSTSMGTTSPCMDCGSTSTSNHITNHSFTDSNGDGRCDYKRSNSSSKCNQTQLMHHAYYTRLDAEKAALYAFLDSYAKKEDGTYYDNRWVSLVTFGSSASQMDMSSQSDTQYWVNLNNDDTLDYVKNTVIKGLSPSGYTNTGDGMEKAKDLLDPKNNKSSSISTIPMENRFAILLTDGVPTRYNDKNYSINKGDPKCSLPAQQGCQAIMALGTEGHHPSLFSIAYCTDSAVVSATPTAGGDKGDVKIMQWLGINDDGSKNSNYCASDVVFAADAADELNDRLTQLLSEIETSGGAGNDVTMAVSNIVTAGEVSTDPYDFVKFINANGATESGDNIAWDLSKARENEGDPEGIKSYTMQYQVRMNTQATGFVEGTNYDLGAASLTYTPLGGESKTAGFENLSAHGYLGSLELTKVAKHDDKALLAGATFQVTNLANEALNMPAYSVGENEVVHGIAVQDISDQNGKVTFKTSAGADRIPSGYSYTLTEVAAPEDYEVDASFREIITVSYGKVTGHTTTTVMNPLEQTYEDVVFTKTWLKPADSVLAKQPITLTVSRKLQASNDNPAAYGTVTINANGTVGSKTLRETVQVTDGSTNNWTITVKHLPLNDPDTGGTWVYTVTEAAVEGYATSGNGTQNITNTASGTTSVTAVKQWILPSSVTAEQKAALTATVQLYKNNTADGDPVTLTGDGDSCTWDGLDVYDAQGQVITYTVVETGCTKGYEEFAANRTSEGGTWTFVNTVTGETTAKTFNKVWNDDGDTSARPADGISVQLKQNGSNYGDAVTVTAPENGGNTWTHEFSNLPRYKFNTENGKLVSVEEYNYTVAEISDVPGYTSKTANMTVTNTRTGLGELTVTKVWVDEFAPNSQPEVEIQLLQNGNEYEKKTTANYTCTFEKLPLYDSNGKAYAYTVAEISNFDGYTTTISYGENQEAACFTNGKAPVTVTNTQDTKDEKVSYSITKIWQQPTDVAYPETLSVKLYRLPEGSTAADIPESVPYGTYTVRMNALTTTATLAENLPRYYYEQVRVETEVETDEYEEDGVTPITEKQVEYESVEHEYVYFAVEECPEDSYTAEEPVYNGNSATFTNTITGTVQITVDKTWKPAVTAYPNAVISVYRGLDLTEAEASTTEIASWTVDAASHTFQNLDKYDADGKLYVYTLKESVTGYTATITKNSDYDFDVENKINQTSITATATKIWVDGGLGNAMRPAITLDLKQGRTKIAAITVDNQGNCTVDPEMEGITASANLSTANQWTVSVSGLDKYDADRQEYSYDFDEVLPDDSNYDKSENGSTITNTLKQEYVNISLTKQWIDPDGCEHAPVTFVLKQNGNPIKTVVLNGTGTNAVAPQDDEGEDLIDLTEDTWYYTFQNLDKYDKNRNLYTYTVEEENVTGYTSEKKEGNLFVNTIEQGKVTVSFSKIWKNSYTGDLQESKQPKDVESIWVALYRQVGTGTPDPVGEPVEVKDNNGVMAYDFSEQDKYSSTGQPYTYTVREGYWHEVEGKDVWVMVDEEGTIEFDGCTYQATYTDTTGDDTFATEATNTFQMPKEYYYKVIGNYQTNVSGKVESIVSKVELVGITAEAANTEPVQINAADYAELKADKIEDPANKGCADTYNYVNGRFYDKETEATTACVTDATISGELAKANNIYTFELNYERNFYQLHVAYEFVLCDKPNGFEDYTENTLFAPGEIGEPDRKTAPVGYELFKEQTGEWNVEDGRELEMTDSRTEINTVVFENSDIAVRYFYKKAFKPATDDVVNDASLTINKLGALLGEDGKYDTEHATLITDGTAVFTIYDETRAYVGTVSTVSGVATISAKALDTGVYTIKETAAPSGYAKSDATWEFRVDKQTSDKYDESAEKYYNQTDWSIALVDGGSTLNVINNREYGYLNVVKVVSGMPGTKTFDFSISGGYTMQITTGNTEGAAGTAILVPTGEYTVTEDETSAKIGGYTLTTTYSGNAKATVTAANDNEHPAIVTVTNAYAAIPYDDDPTPKPPVTPPEDIDEPDVPLAGEPEIEDLGDGDVPLAGAPDDEELEELEEEEVPLAAVPRTSDMALLWLVSSALSGIGLGALNLKKREDEDEQ